MCANYKIIALVIPGIKKTEDFNDKHFLLHTQKTSLQTLKRHNVIRVPTTTTTKENKHFQKQKPLLLPF